MTNMHRRSNTADSLAPPEGKAVTNKDSLNQSSMKGTDIKSNDQNTCVKLSKKQNRYSNSPLGKRFDIYETTEDDEQLLNS
jgi:hypothetical protein